MQHVVGARVEHDVCRRVARGRRGCVSMVQTLQMHRRSTVSPVGHSVDTNCAEPWGREVPKPLAAINCTEVVRADGSSLEMLEVWPKLCCILTHPGVRSAESQQDAPNELQTMTGPVFDAQGPPCRCGVMQGLHVRRVSVILCRCSSPL